MIAKTIEGNIIISKREYEDFLVKEKVLELLEKSGVRGWRGYHELFGEHDKYGYTGLDHLRGEVAMEVYNI